MKRKKLSLMICVSAVMLLLTGCTGSDLNSAVFVSTAGLAYDGKEYAVSVCGSAADRDGEKNITASGKGRTVEEALEDIRRSTGYEPFFGHCGAAAADANALRDGTAFEFLADSRISPACRIYYSDDPLKAAENIADEGFTEEMYRAAVCLDNNAAMVLPLAEEPYRTVSVTEDSVYRNDMCESIGLMMLRGADFSREFTVKTESGYVTAEISPKEKRSAEYIDGALVMKADIRLNAKDCGSCAEEELISAAETLCRDAFEKCVVEENIDSVGLYKLIGYKKPELNNARLELKVAV